MNYMFRYFVQPRLRKIAERNMFTRLSRYYWVVSVISVSSWVRLSAFHVFSISFNSSTASGNTNAWAVYFNIVLSIGGYLTNQQAVSWGHIRNHAWIYIA